MRVQCNAPETGTGKRTGTATATEAAAILRIEDLNGVRAQTYSIDADRQGHAMLHVHEVLETDA